jgi:D-glycero-D-manno-heptose 1,7-bisphosphate phosphatase
VTGAAFLPSLRPAVFVDRDGVVNRPLVHNSRPYSPRDPAEFEVLPGVPDACAALRRAGYFVVVVTNQPDVSRGLLTKAQLDEMHDRLREQVDVDDIRVCPHDDGDHCHCRKPAPGLLVDAARTHGLNLDRSFMVGDRWRDVEAGRRAGCLTVLVDYGWDEPAGAPPDATVHDLYEAVQFIFSTVERSA